MHSALVLRCGEATLRLASQEDDDLIIGLMPDDFDYDPTFPRDVALTLVEDRQAWLRHWLHGFRNPASADDWFLPFVVSAHGASVGFQVLEGEGFRRHRQVDSSSFLVPEARGQGLGVAMRTAVLFLAFEVLGAERAISAARPDNIASHRVSERVGYIKTGRKEPMVAGMVRAIDTYELTRARWDTLAHQPVQITGATPASVLLSRGGGTRPAGLGLPDAEQGWGACDVLGCCELPSIPD